MSKERYLNCKYLDAGMDGMLCSMNLCTTCKEFNGEKCSYYMPKNKSKDKEIQKVSSTIPNRFGQQGWICPKCGAVLSPFTSICPFCAPKETTVTAGSYTISSIDVDWTKQQSITVSQGERKGVTK